MKTLSISTDRKIFEKGSPVSLRMIEYARDCEEIHIIVFTTSSFKITEQLETVEGLPPRISLAPNCFAYPTRSLTKILCPLDAEGIGSTICRRTGISEITCQDPFLTAMAGISLKRKFNLPLEIQLHTDVGSPHYAYSVANRLRRFLAVKYIPEADKVRVVSDRVKENLLKLIPIDRSRITVRPIPVNVFWIKDAPILFDLHKKYPQFEKIVLMASRIEPEKNIKLAVDIWRNIVPAFPKTGLIIVGRGSQGDRLKSMVSRLNLGGNIVFEDWAQPDTLISYMKTADFFLNTSLFEGYGMTLIEAQAADCPIISTDVGVARQAGAILIPFEAAEASRKIMEFL